MKTIKKLSYALMSLALLLTACKKPIDESKGVVLTPDVTSITNDGEDSVVFTVTYNGVDVTDKASIRNLTDTKLLDGNEFSSKVVGDYKFFASYKPEGATQAEKSPEVTIAVTSIKLSADKEVIYAGSGDKVTFTLMNKEQNLTSDAVITNITTGETYAKGVNTFTAPSYAGEFQFRAKSNGLISNTITVKVEIASFDLVLDATKARIKNNGSDNTTFSVMYKGQDVTADAKIKNQTTGEYLTGKTFAYSGSDKTVKFVAEYNDEVSNTFTVGFGDFYKRVFIQKFTATGCVFCYDLSEKLDAAELLNPDRTDIISIHYGEDGNLGTALGKQLMSKDLAAVLKYYSWGSSDLPYTWIEGQKAGWPGTTTDVNSLLGLIKPHQRVQAKVGIAAKSTLNGTDITVNAKVTASVAGEYYLGAMLLENGITGYPQAGASGAIVRNHVFRKMATPGVMDESLGSMAVDQEVSKTITVNTDKFNAKNCSVILYVIYKDKDEKGKDIYVAANSVVVSSNGIAGYRFEE